MISASNLASAYIGGCLALTLVAAGAPRNFSIMTVIGIIIWPIFSPIWAIRGLGHVRERGDNK